MHTHRHRQSGQSNPAQGPAWFYGYCHDTGQMRMMTYPDYVTNMQTGYSNLYNAIPSMAQPATGATQTAPAYSSRRSHHGCHEHHVHHESDCGCDCLDDCECECSCHIRCADAVEYAHCGEVRRIPITFENDTRRDRDVALTLGTFATSSGQEVGWQTSLSDTKFTLPACGHKTVMLTVPVQCGSTDSAGNSATNSFGTAGQVDSCKVAYATLRAEGCRVRPLVIAVAVVPDRCGSHHADCGCGCC
jgi:hypothetical protein